MDICRGFWREMRRKNKPAHQWRIEERSEARLALNVIFEISNQFQQPQLSHQPRRLLNMMRGGQRIDRSWMSGDKLNMTMS